MELLDNLKINQRMNTLNRTVRDAQRQLQRTAEDRYTDMKDAIESAGTFISATAAKTDKMVRKNPWAAVGTVAAAALLIGYFVGRFRSREQ